MSALPSRSFADAAETGASPGLVIPEAYHGSKTAKIMRFERRQGVRTAYWTTHIVPSTGFFFAFSAKEAAEYGSHVSRYQLGVQNPLLYREGIPDQRCLDDIAYIALALFTEIDGDFLVFRGIQDDYFIHSDPEKRDTNWVWSFIGAEYVSQGLDLIIRRYGISWELLDHPECVRRMRERGYDGTLVSEPHLESKLSWFVVEPEQIRFLGTIEDEIEEDDDY